MWRSIPALPMSKPLAAPATNISRLPPVPTGPKFGPVACFLLPVQLCQVFLRIFIEILEAILAAKLEFLAIADERVLLPRLELLIRHDASLQRVWSNATGGRCGRMVGGLTTGDNTQCAANQRAQCKR